MQGARHAVLTFLSAAVLIAACTGDAPPRPGELRGSLLPGPIEKTAFTLTTTEGEPFDFAAETDSSVTLLFFGYTYCPDICPVHMANIAAALGRLPPQISNQVTVIMVSVDPDRDTPERLRNWLDNFDRSFIGLLGPAERVTEIQLSLHMPPAVKQEIEGEGYLMGHAAQVMAFTADNRAHVLYPSGTRQVDWAHDIPLLVERDWSQR